MRNQSSIIIAAFAIVFLFASLSCSDEGSSPTQQPPPPSEVSFSQHIQPIFQNTQYGCLGCHGGAGGLSLTAGQSYGNLVNVRARTQCADRMRVLPSNPSQSVLYLRLSGFTCGERMPQGGNAITSQHLDLIRDWITQGAKNN
jgi:hypothetical protein